MTTEAENTQAAETNTTAAAEAAQAKEVTLDDVYRDAGLDKLASADTRKEEKVEAKAETRMDALNVPDPYDSEKFKAFMAQQAAGTTALNQTVTEIAKFLSAQQQREAMAATRADIDNAVKVVNEVVGHSKPKVIEAAIDGMVRDDARLKAIWDNRGKNPAAWNNALKIVTKQIAEDFSVKVDPALVNAQRARKEAQKQMATTSSESETSAAEERLGKATGADFESGWQQLVSGGN